MATITKDLGVATAYGYAVAGGYTGTEEEFAELMASYASVAQEAEESAETAEAYAKGTVDGTPVGSGETGYHDNAKYYAEQASGSATDADNSATAASGSASGASASALKSEGHAVGQQNGSDVGSGSPYYHNNAKYYKEQASGSASAASGSAGTAADQALVSEGYAKGTQSGTPVASGTYYHDNAKYYKEQADGDASSASASATAANTDALKAEGYAVGKQNGTDVGSGSPYYENNAKYYASEAADSATEAAASAASIDPDTLAKIDGYYESMTVGNAEQLVATVGVEDSVPFNFRTTGGSADVGDRKTMEVVGGTVAWNQLAKEINATNWSVENANVTVTFANGVATFASTQVTYGIKSSMGVIKPSHKYLISLYAKAESAFAIAVLLGNMHGTTKNFLIGTSREQAAGIITTAGNVYGATAYVFPVDSNGINKQIEVDNIAIFDLTQMFGSTIADYIYSLETANAGAGVAWFKKLFPKPYYAYNAGELMSVKTSAYASTGFNQWDEEWEVGAISSSTGEPCASTGVIRSKNFCPCVPGIAYYVKTTSENQYIFWYDASKNFVSAAQVSNATATSPANACFFKIQTRTDYGVTYKNDICINLHWDGERDGEYEPYETHTYALDSDLELRGIPKLDADNQLYYDGDVYESDGTVKRRYLRVDLGSLTWIKATENTRFYVSISVTDPTAPQPVTDVPVSNAICPKYITTSRQSLLSIDKAISVHTAGVLAYINVNDSAYENSDAATFKAAMSGVYLVYELATPGEETADPFQTPQIINDFGTEEFVDTRTIPIPVGHNSKYQANLRAKLEMAPNSPSGDGDYIVRQSSGQNTYVPITFPADELPAAPTTDGNYMLKCTVSSGTATFEWEAQT